MARGESPYNGYKMPKKKKNKGTLMEFAAEDQWDGNGFVDDNVMKQMDVGRVLVFLREIN